VFDAEIERASRSISLRCLLFLFRHIGTVKEVTQALVFCESPRVVHFAVYVSEKRKNVADASVKQDLDAGRRFSKNQAANDNKFVAVYGFVKSKRSFDGILKVKAVWLR
jgi:hypothetical protein